LSFSSKSYIISIIIEKYRMTI